MKIKLTKAPLLIAGFLATSMVSIAMAQISKGPVPPNYKPPVSDSSDANFVPPPNTIVQPSPGQGNNHKVSPIDQLLTYTQKSATGFGDTAILKFVYQVKNPAVYLVDVNKYKYHIEYATQVLGYKKSNDIFNLNYVGNLADREYVLGTILLLKDDKQATGYKFLFEIWNGDNLDISGIRTVQAAVSSQMPSGVELLFHPMSLDQEKLAIDNLPKQQFALTKELIGNRSFLIFNQAEAYGYIRFASTDPNKADAFDLTTMAVYDHVPNDIGLVGGVITAEAQTPLSHVNVKSMNRNTMNIYLKNAKEVLKPYENKAVKIVLRSDKPEITVISDPKKADLLIAEFWKKRRPKLNGTPQFVLDPAYDNAFIPLNTYYKNLPNKAIHSELIRRVGAKAANLGLLNALTLRLGLKGITSPETLGVPFNFYEQFMNLSQKGLDPLDANAVTTPQAMTEKILKQYDLLNPNVIHPTEQVRKGLAEIQAMYLKAQVPDSIMAVFKTAILDDLKSPVHISKHARLRLRSSTNSEDLDGFTGAGLYDSDGFNLYAKKDDGTYDRSKPATWAQIERRIRRILPALYSSVWNERAYQEREWYQMNGNQHLMIKVGLAFHSAFPLMGFEGLAEVANGVAVTTNIYNPNDWGKVYLNAQHYDLAVTNPPVLEDLEALGEPVDQNYRTEEILVTSFTADDQFNKKPQNWLRWPVEVLANSSVKKGAAVLQAQETLKLAHAFWLLNKEMAKVYKKKSDQFSIDIEWKIYGPDRQLIIKQARPFVPPAAH